MYYCIQKGRALAGAPTLINPAECCLLALVAISYRLSAIINHIVNIASSALFFRLSGGDT